MAACVPAIIGSTLTWYTFSIDGLQLSSYTGTQNGKDGNVTLWLGIITAVILVVYLNSQRRWVLTMAEVTSVLIFLVCAVDQIQLAIMSKNGASYTAGLGLWIVVASGIGLMAGTTKLRKEHKARKEVAPVVGTRIDA